MTTNIVPLRQRGDCDEKRERQIEMRATTAGAKLDCPYP